MVDRSREGKGFVRLKGKEWVQNNDFQREYMVFKRQRRVAWAIDNGDVAIDGGLVVCLNHL